MKTAKQFVIAAGLLLTALPAGAQIMTGPYGGPNYVPDQIPSYGIYAPQPSYHYEPPQTFYTPPLPSIPDPSRGIGQGGGPYGTALPSGPSSYPCTMPGCR
jgi:hypothetical protein